MFFTFITNHYTITIHFILVHCVLIICGARFVWRTRGAELKWGTERWVGWVTHTMGAVCVMVVQIGDVLTARGFRFGACVALSLVFDSTLLYVKLIYMRHF